MSDLAKQYGVEVEGFEQPIVTENKFYQHPVGIYTGVIGALETIWKDKEGKKVTKDTPGAVSNGGNLKLYILEQNGEKLLYVKDNKFVVADKMTSQMLAYNVFVSNNPVMNFRNELFFKDFKYDGNSALDIVPEAGKVVIRNTAYFVGCKVQFKLTETESKGKKYINVEEVELLEKAFSDEAYKKRLGRFQAIKNEVETLYNIEKKARDEKAKAKGQATANVDTVEADEIISNLDLDGLA